MGSLGSPKTWVPYTSSKDCSQGFCSLYCPQWCYIIFPPPPPFDFPDDNSTPNFSPLVIAIIGILASAFLLVSYYTIISKYCGNTDRSTRSENHDLDQQELEDTNHQHPSLHEPWHIETTGLDDALIKSITACKYKKGDGLVDGTDCSVCLSEFHEDETVRLLPKCSHAFHLPCIDTWLRSHSNCPLCRANIVSFSAASPLPLPQLVENPSNDAESLMDETQRANENALVVQDTERVGGGGEEVDCLGDHGNVSKDSLRAFSDLGNSEERDIVIEIRDERYDQSVRRSVSMDHSSHNRVLVADILSMNEDVHEEEYCSSDGACSSKVLDREIGKACRRRGVLHCVMSPVAMKRSFSSGRFFLTKPGRERHPIIPF